MNMQPSSLFRMLASIAAALLLAALATTAALAEAGAAPKPQAQEEIVKFEPKGKYFSVQIPAAWERREFEFMKAHELYELAIWAPGTEALGYVIFEVKYFASAEKSPERFILDQLGSSSGNGAKEALIHGRTVKTLEIAADRYPPLGMQGDKLAVLRQYAVYPMGKGYFVLSYDAPAAVAGKYRPVYETMLDSFTPQVAEKEDGQQEVSAEEYQLLTDFFGNKYDPGKQPEYFTWILKARAVKGMTLKGAAPEPGSIKIIEEQTGKIDSALLEDYKSKNLREYRIKDKIQVKNLTIHSGQNSQREDLGAFRQQEMQMSRMSHLLRYEKGVTFSGIGFNKARTLAFFHVSSYGVSPGTGFFVLMAKEDGRWLVKAVAMNKVVIY